MRDEDEKKEKIKQREGGKNGQNSLASGASSRAE